jgi:hypothetical protein
MLCTHLPSLFNSITVLIFNATSSLLCADGGLMMMCVFSVSRYCLANAQDNKFLAGPRYLAVPAADGSLGPFG